jgi:sec-independent protein translocase protein TatA
MVEIRMSIGPREILVILLVVLILFGGSRLSDIGKGLGEGIKNFKKGLKDEDPPAPQATLKSGAPPEAHATQPKSES